MKFLEPWSDIKSDLKQFVTRQKYKIRPQSQTIVWKVAYFFSPPSKVNMYELLISNQAEMIQYRAELLITKFLKGKKKIEKQTKLHRQRNEENLPPTISYTCTQFWICDRSTDTCGSRAFVYEITGHRFVQTHLPSFFKNFFKKSAEYIETSKKKKKKQLFY